MADENDQLILQINLKLVEYHSALRVNAMFDAVWLRELASLSGFQIHAAIRLEPGLLAMAAPQDPFEVLNPPEPPLTKVISYDRPPRRTTEQMINALGDIVTMPRAQWRNYEMQAIAEAYSGVGEVLRVPGADRLNGIWTRFSSELTMQCLEHAEFFAAMDPIVVIVDFFVAHTADFGAPHGYKEFIASLLAPFSSGDSLDLTVKNNAIVKASMNKEKTLTALNPLDASTSTTVVVWPSGTAPLNIGDSYTIFQCNTGSVTEMLSDAEALATAITTRFPSVRVHRAVTAGNLTRLENNES